MNRAATVLLFLFLPSTNFCLAAIFDANPRNVVNRLYSALCIRDDRPAIAYGEDALDPPLWRDTTHLLLTGSSHQLALNILNGFLRTHAEKQISSPLKKALLQRDLWAIFDWSALTREDHVRERQQLQIQLAEILRRLALTSEELSSLPDNYAQAVASGTFAKQYDAASPERPFLPPDLLESHGPWVRVTAEWQPVAEEHAYALSGRSSFLVFVRLPQGRQATLDYFRTLWNAPEPWIASAIDRGENSNLPQFPVGTQVALLRHMNLFDHDGTLVSTPITESIQFRVYRVITSRRDENNIDVDFPAARTEQNFYELRLSQAQLLKENSGGLHAVAPGDAEFPTFQTHGRDAFEHSKQDGIESPLPILQRCVACHSAPGVHSLLTLKDLLKPNRAQVDPDHGRNPDAAANFPWWQDGDTLPWKQQQYDWGLLNGYWLANR